MRQADSVDTISWKLQGNCPACNVYSFAAEEEVGDWHQIVPVGQLLL